MKHWATTDVNLYDSNDLSNLTIRDRNSDFDDGFSICESDNFRLF